MLSADLASIQPVPSPGTVPADPAIYVDLDERNVREPTELSQQGQQTVELFRVSPALFVENQGQWSDSSIRYLHDGTAFDVAMTDTGVLFRGTDADLRWLQFSASFLGANLVRPMGLERSATVFNYSVGDPAAWRQNVPSYEVVTYEGLYEGIDLHVQGLRSHVKSEFHVVPGVDYSRIAVRYEGVEGLSLASDGSLEVNLGAGRGVIRDDAPYIYQEIDGQKVEVAGRFVLLDNRTYAFEITGPIDPDHVLVIDPNLAWSTYVGASGYEEGYGIAMDSSGSVYVTGYTTSSDWTSGGFDTSYNGGDDAFVVKLSSSGVHLWSTYLGGSGSDHGNGITLDASGNVFVTGSTSSSDWTSGGFDTSYDGGDDAFVVKLSSSGAHLWSAYLGGSGAEAGKAIAVDDVGNAYVTGETASSGWTSGGFDTSYNGGGYYHLDAFAAKLSADGAHLWSTYLGGSDDDRGYGIAVDSSGNVLVTGSTWSAGWTAGGWDTTYGGNEDGFAAKLSTDGAHLWSTYLGGDSPDWGNGIAVDVSGNVHVTGSTDSAGWTSGGFDTTFNGSMDPFVIKLSANGAHLWSTYLGGGSGDSSTDIAVDAAGDVFVAGSTWWSPGWTSGGWDTSPNGSEDAYAAKLSPDGQSLWSTYLGGDGDDAGNGIVLDAWDGVYVVGYTNSVGWTTGGFDTTFQGHDAFVAKLWSVWDVTPPSPNPSTWATEPYATGEVSIRMVATTATDNRGVEYYFDEISGSPGGTDSDWQDSNVYEDTGLSPGTTYIYRVRTRDKSENLNETAYSTSRAATTQPLDTVPPSPNPSTWSAEPYATNEVTIRMGATPATDINGVEYYFHETSGNSGGTESGWQDSNIYEDTGLAPGATYLYQVKTRDKSISHNETGYSALGSATTPPDTTPPSPDPTTWAIQPYAVNDATVRMTATTARDLTGVEYSFEEITGNPGGMDSGWQDSSTYEDAGLAPGTAYTYRVKTRDKSVNHNETGYSDSCSVTTQPDMTPPSPDPSTWATEPFATGLPSIRMVATMATDVSGVEYYFHEASGNPGGTDSGWQDSNIYEDTGLSPDTTYIYEVKTRDRSVNHNETGYSTARAATTAPTTAIPVYRFWSDTLSRHFYTIREGEKNKLIDNFSHVWTYETVAYYAFSTSQPGTSPIYRFWSDTLHAHVYTMKAAERDKLINNYSSVWTYEGIAFYAYTPGAQPTGTMGVYRFWSPTLNCHFYTAKLAERDKLINSFSSVWTYEDVMWYAYGA